MSKSPDAVGMCVCVCVCVPLLNSVIETDPAKHQSSFHCNIN